MLSLLHKAYSGIGVEFSVVDASCHDLCSSPQLFILRAGEELTSFSCSMDTILRLLEGLRRDELVWLNTYLTGRLRAMPPPATAAATVQVSAVPARASTAVDSVGELPVAALAERVGDFNVSMDPWERTGAAPQGWAPHLHQTVIPVQGYIQLRPHDTTLPSFGGCPIRQLLERRTNLLIPMQRPWEVVEKHRHR